MKKKNDLVCGRSTTLRVVVLALLAVSLFVNSALAKDIEPLKVQSLTGIHQPDAPAGLVVWKSIVGVISAPNVVNPVGNIQSGTFPWSVRSGIAQVNLSNGETSFQVRGLVINGQIFSGTAGPVTGITGTLVCNPGDNSQAVRDTREVHLSLQGDAHFSGRIENIPANCDNPLFLIRISTPAGAAGRWIATGAQRSMAN